MTTTDSEKYVDYLDLIASTWKRPEGPKRIWRNFDGRRKTANGQIPRFSIQEIPEELEDEVIDFMVKYFLPEEPTCVSQGITANSLAVRECRTLWKLRLKQGISVAAFTMESDPSAKPLIAGANILGVVTAEDEANSVGRTIPYRSTLMKTFVSVQNKLLQESNVLTKYGVDKYLSAFGLSVDPRFRGQGIGEELLRIREDIGIAYQISVTETMFTSKESQILASRTGFEVLVERKYDELFDEEGNIAFPVVDVEFTRIMGKRLY